MEKLVCRFLLSASLYWLCTAYAGQVLVLPPTVIHLSVFLPPLLGLMWGPVAAVGVYLGGLAAAPELGNLLDGEMGWPEFIGRGFWVFLAGYLPYRIWHVWRVKEGEPRFSLQPGTMVKALWILFATFVVTSVFRGLTVSPEELAATAGWLGMRGSMRIVEYMLACFVNDFDVAVFGGIGCFFSLIRCGFSFHTPTGNQRGGDFLEGAPVTDGARKAWGIALAFYGMFIALFVYLDLYHIYGMNDMEVWLQFNLECLTMMDFVLALLLYLLLCFRHSIMMEIVFLVALTVFLSAAVLGWGSSVAMGRFVTERANDSLKAMSVICRERLDRTFQCVRQAVIGMENEAANSLESYERLVGDEAYRESYLSSMARAFESIAASTDGICAFYLRLEPGIAGSQGGFSMGREELRWEGSLAPFARRTPIDLFLYSPYDTKNVGWYYLPVRSGHATWIEPYVDPTARDYVISYVTPLYADGNFVGIIGMDIDFGFIIQELRRMSIYNYGYTYIMNRNGRVLYHRDFPQGAMFQPNPEFQEMEIYLTNGMWLGIAMPLDRVHEERNQVSMHLIAALLVVAMLVSLGSILLVSRIIRPLTGVTEAAEKIAAGDLKVNLDYNSDNEVGILVKSIREMAAKLEVYVYRDKLTGLRNAASYISKGTEFDERRKAGEELRYGVVIFDANFLKRINDRYGHDAGNELIRHAAQVICRVFAHSPVYRIGGDEFAAILEHQDYENRNELLRRFDEEAAKECFEVGGEMHVVSVARGLAIYEPGMDYAAVAKKADVAMYNHKSAIKMGLGEDLR